jgi:hypothetical protein
MTLHQCLYCDRLFNKMSNYKSHLEKKASCKKNPSFSTPASMQHALLHSPSSNSNEIEILPSMYKKIVKPPQGQGQGQGQGQEQGHGSGIIGQGQGQSPGIIGQGTGQCQTDNVDDVLYQCNFCLYSTNRNHNLKRHLQSCRIRKEENKDKEEIFKELVMKYNELKIEHDQLYESILELKKDNISRPSFQIVPEPTTKDHQIQIPQTANHINNIHTNNTQTNNTQTNNTGTINNNIIFQFGKEDLSKIDDKFITDALKLSGYFIPIKMVENIHCNPLYPHFHNVYISNIDKGKAMIHTGEKWELSNYNAISDNLLDKSVNLIEERVKEIATSTATSVNRKMAFDRKMKVLEKIKQIDYDDENNDHLDDNELRRRDYLRKMSKDGIKLVLYNKRDTIRHGKNNN